MKRTEKTMLLDALKSNGGGINCDLYPESTRKRLMKNGLIQWKPNQHKSNHFASLLTLTQEGGRVARELLTEGVQP